MVAASSMIGTETIRRHRRFSSKRNSPNATTEEAELGFLSTHPSMSWRSQVAAIRVDPAKFWLLRHQSPYHSFFINRIDRLQHDKPLHRGWNRER